MLLTHLQLALGFFSSEEDIDTYVRELKELHHDPSRKVSQAAGALCVCTTAATNIVRVPGPVLCNHAHVTEGHQVEIWHRR